MAVIEVIKKKPKTAAGMKHLLQYIAQEQKTTDSLKGGKNCDFQNAFEEYMLTKEEWNKRQGIQCIHFVQSFAAGEASPGQAKEAAERLLAFPQFEGFQVIYAVHTDRRHIHTHFVINSVNELTGKKWHQTPQELQQLKDYSDQICRELGLPVLENKREGCHIPQGEYRAKKKGVSWKGELYFAVMGVRRHAKNKEQFLAGMSALGYQVKWGSGRKHITFTTPDGKKCRGNKLYPPERFTKEALLKTFEQNRKYRQANKLDAFLHMVQVFQKHKDTKYPLTTLANNRELEGQALKDYLYHFEEGSIYNKNLKTQSHHTLER